MPQSVRLVPTLRRGGGGSSCVLCVCLSLLDLCVGGGGVVHVFSVSASVCWTCADITSGGGGSSCVLCVCLSLLDLCVGGGGGGFMCSL